MKIKLTLIPDEKCRHDAEGNTELDAASIMRCISPHSSCSSMFTIVPISGGLKQSKIVQDTYMYMYIYWRAKVHVPMPCT